MNCSSCGALVPPGKRFCADCGAPLSVACPACGSANALTKKFCGDCGQVLPAPPPRGQPPVATAAPTTPAAPPAGPAPASMSGHAASPAADRATGAERRQLTVMFCDLVGSTALANRLDPEDWQGVIRSYHAAVSDAVASYEGHVAQLLGDGVLVYFGYPRAHEDDAVRAVRAALAVLPAVAALQPQGDASLQTRIGIATGLVVVGKIGAGTPASEHSASGETPNLAARLQGVASPGEILVSESTRMLLGASFELEALGVRVLKGFAEPVPAWRVQGERGHASRFEAQHERELNALIGRDSELALLLDRWALARDGEAQVVLLSGEAGIGKSRVCQALRERLRDEPHTVIVLQCSPYFSGSALYPVVQQLQRAAGVTADDTPAQRRAKLHNVTRSLPSDAVHALRSALGMAAADDAPASAESGAAEPASTPQQIKSQALHALVALVREAAAERATLLWVEDAHWIDPTTQEWLALLLDQLRDSRLLTVITTRPPEELTLGSPAHLTRLTLARLSQRQCGALINAVALGKALPGEVQEQIIRKTDGVPLFVEELTKTVLQSGLLEDSPQGYRLTQALPELAIPSTLADSLMARLDRLSAAKSVAQAGAAIGREFSYRLLARVMHDDTARLDTALAELIGAGLLVRRGVAPDVSYQFKHALVRDTAYNSMLKSQRVLRHRQIADGLEQTEPDTVVTRPELLAHHFQEAGDKSRAIEEWIKAGHAAVAKGAHREAAQAFERSLGVLETVPETPRAMSQALAARIALGPLYFGLHGATQQVEHCYSAALALADRLDDQRQVFPALWGLNYVDFFRGRYSAALDTARRLLQVALDSGDSGQLIEAHHSMWGLLAASGDLGQAVEHLEHGRSLYNESVHSRLRYQYAGHDPGACCLTWTAATSWLRGYPDLARRQVLTAFKGIACMPHSMTKVLLVWTAWVHYQCGELEVAASQGRHLAQVIEQYGFHVVAGPAAVFGELALSSRPTGERLSEIARLVAASRSSKFLQAMTICILIDLGLATGESEFAWRLIVDLKKEEPGIHSAEIFRLEGRLLCLQDSLPSAAERCFLQAIDIARGQGAKSFELRAATSLAELWQQQGKLDEARRLLGDIYGWFTEGFDTADLRRAKALLDELNQGASA